MPTVRPARNVTEHVDPDMHWLAREAPQFHTQPDHLSTYNSSKSKARDDDGSSVSGSEEDASGTEDEEDPYHPYNVVEAGTKWVQAGDFVYSADNLQPNYLSGNGTHVVDNAAFVQPGVAGRHQAYPPTYMAPGNVGPQRGPYFLSTYPYGQQAPRAHNPYLQAQQLYQGQGQVQVQPQQQPQSVSPLDLTKPLPSISAPVSHTRTRNAPQAGSSSSAAIRTSSRLNAMKAQQHYEEYVASSSEDEASGDEYVPSPRLRTRTLRGPSSVSPSKSGAVRYSHSPYDARSPATSDMTMSSSSSTSSRNRPGSRNLQIFDQPPPPRGSWSKTGPDAYRCPYCGHVQTNKRSPDMERHIRSHFRNVTSQQWVCCGVPIEEEAAYGVDGNVNAWTFNGRLMVGGCHEDFSRMDALKRHWKNKNNSCVGDIRYARAADE